MTPFGYSYLDNKQSLFNKVFVQNFKSMYNTFKLHDIQFGR